MWHRPAMAMYYLSQSGDVQGPFAEGRLLQMAEAGEIGTAAQVAMHGTEDWFPVAHLLDTLRAERDEREKIESQRAQASRPVAERKRELPLMWVAALVFLLGVGTLFAFWPLGLLLIVLGIVLDAKQIWVCGACGNRVEKTSQQCPNCQVRLVKELPKKR